MSTSETRVKGLSELQRFLDQLPAKMESTVVRTGLRAGGKVFQQGAQALVPTLHGGLRKGIRVKLRRVGGKVIAQVISTGPANLPLWIEVGVQAHEIEPRKLKAVSLGGAEGGFTADGGELVFAHVHHPGVKPHPYMRPAMDANTERAVLAFANQIKRALARKQANGSAVFDKDVTEVEITL